MQNLAQELRAVRRSIRDGRLALAFENAQGLANRHPNHAQVLNLFGLASLKLQETGNARLCFEKALSVDPELVDARVNLGFCLFEQGAWEEAKDCFCSVVAEHPDNPRAAVGLARTLHRLGRADDGLEILKQSATRNPDKANVQAWLGRFLDFCGDSDSAEDHLRRALALAPGDARVKVWLATVLSSLNRCDEAEALLRDVLRIEPERGHAQHALGVVLLQKGTPHAALPVLEKALAFIQDDAILLRDLGSAYHLTRNYKAACDTFESALVLDPELDSARILKWFDGAMMCDWDTAPTRDALGAFGNRSAVSPWLALHLEDAPIQQRDRARAWSARLGPTSEQALPAQPLTKGRRLRIGYFSSDIYNHATLHLMAGMFRSHDRSRFDIAMFSYGRCVQDSMRGLVQENVDQFHDVHDLADSDVVHRAHDMKLDIAIDLKGHTEGNRLRLFAERLAPVQITHLGFPGTLGAKFIDYLVVDDVLVPPSQRHSYDEALIYLPGCYQPNQTLATRQTGVLTRQDVGLPPAGIVLCCFNAPYKIKPPEFSIWMRVLKACPDAVLWLLDDNVWAVANLKKRALAAGVKADRLIFAKAVPRDAHLDRLGLADLCLDTFIVGAHTTASDALAAGVPVVTCAGAQFAARVGASLLTSVGLAELVAEDAQHYEDTLLRLCRSRVARERITSALSAGQHHLFDEQRYTKTFEAAVFLAFQNKLAGGPPTDIASKDIQHALETSKVARA